MWKWSSRRALLVVLVFVTFALTSSRAAADDDAGAPAETALVAPSHRPAGLLPLYMSYVALQAVDVHSTFDAIHHGGREVNPVMGSALNSPAALVALKAVSTAGLFYSTEHLWKKHRVAAVFLMIGVNSAYAAVAAHNYSIARRHM